MGLSPSEAVLQIDIARGQAMRLPHLKNTLKDIRFALAHRDLNTVKKLIGTCRPVDQADILSEFERSRRITLQAGKPETLKSKCANEKYTNLPDFI